MYSETIQQKTQLVAVGGCGQDRSNIYIITINHLYVNIK